MAEKRGKILIVDDEASMREMLAIMLQRDGFEVVEAVNGVDGIAQFGRDDFDLVISDIRMPKKNGIELLREIRALDAETLVIMMTAFSTTEEAVEAMKLGAYDYITKPFKTDEVRLIIAKALEKSILQRENVALKSVLKERYSFANLIGKSAAMQRIYSLIERVAGSQANILVSGESGTGKELVARAIHFNGPRRVGPFVPVNCGAIPETLIESELFGHEKGAFTGAERLKKGLFETANGGTLFLDEIGELPLGMQVKLLRVLQEREFRRVGGTSDHPLDIRLVVATNKNLEAEVESGAFREDLFYRLNVVRIDLPPLRERTEDVPLLLEYFFRQHGQSVGPSLPPETLHCLLAYSWPGNIRELANLAERAMALGWTRELPIEALPQNLQCESEGKTFECRIPEDGFDLDAHLAEIEKAILIQALQRSGGVRKRAAELLGISFRSIRYRLEKLGLDAEAE